jgi:hypothetical protein
MGKMVVAEYTDKILTGDTAHIESYKLAEKHFPSTEEPTDSGIVASFHVNSLEVAKFLCELAQLGALRPMRLSGVSIDTAEWLQNNYDISLEVTKDGGHLLT